MWRLCSRTMTLAVVGLIWATGVGAQERASPDRATMARRVDELLSQRWEREGVQPAARSSDSEFLRRVALDLTGVIPRVADVRSFLEDPRSDKRERLIGELLESPGHATHLANSWRKRMLPIDTDPGQLDSIIGVQNWLRQQFVSNKRYDNVVGELMVATEGGPNGPALFFTTL